MKSSKTFFFFGVVGVLKELTYRAVESALLQQHALEQLRKSWAERGLPQLRVRIGLTVGRVWAGEKRYDEGRNPSYQLQAALGPSLA